MTGAYPSAHIPPPPQVGRHPGLVCNGFTILLDTVTVFGLRSASLTLSSTPSIGGRICPSPYERTRRWVAGDQVSHTRSPLNEKPPGSLCCVVVLGRLVRSPQDIFPQRAVAREQVFQKREKALPLLGCRGYFLHPPFLPSTCCRAPEPCPASLPAFVIARKPIGSFARP
ncbi:hypothetical protein VTK73DRAFT_10135 [Phialemonium thermophilum]|uniref:Uncharacterized protein n=1 Tax=Phialemonium thermophilum TaxID=223376 RepID=A0ABR3VYE4_9PEZI